VQRERAAERPSAWHDPSAREWCTADPGPPNATAAAFAVLDRSPPHTCLTTPPPLHSCGRRALASRPAAERWLSG
jgi:hypothetical protein